jgi:hypothetical protein
MSDPQPFYRGMEVWYETYFRWPTYAVIIDEYHYCWFSNLYILTEFNIKEIATDLRFCHPWQDPYD